MARFRNGYGVFTAIPLARFRVPRKKRQIG